MLKWVFLIMGVFIGFIINLGSKIFQLAFILGNNNHVNHSKSEVK